MSSATPGVSAPPLPFGERWRRVPRRWQVTMVVVGVLVLAEMSASLVSGLGSSGSGAQGPASSYDSSAAGTEAFAQLLGLRGHDVRRETTPLPAVDLPAGTTLFVLDPGSWNSSDTRALAAALGRGDRVVLGGRPPGTGVLRAVLGPGPVPTWQLRPAGRAHPVGRPAPTGVTTVVSPGPGSYTWATSSGHSFRPLVAGADAVLAVSGSDSGLLVVLGSSSSLENEAIGRDDDAAWALDLAGPGRAVAFDEYDHGFGRPGSGLAGLPARWRVGLALAVVALLVWLLSAARRFGPPARQERPMIPPRIAYVDALATLLSTRPPDELGEVLAPVPGEAGGTGPGADCGATVRWAELGPR